MICLLLIAGKMYVAYVLVLSPVTSYSSLCLKQLRIDFEMAGTKEQLQMLYQLDGHAQKPCYRMQTTASHIPGCENSTKEGQLMEVR